MMLRTSVHIGRACRSSGDTSKSAHKAATLGIATSQTNSAPDAFTSTSVTSDLNTRPTFGFEILKGRMTELLSVAAMTLRLDRVDVYSGRATAMFFQLTQHLNCAMGHDAIDLLKRLVVEQGPN